MLCHRSPELVPLVLGAVTEGVVGEDQRGHGLDHWHGSWQDAGVVAAPAPEGGVF